MSALLAAIGTGLIGLALGAALQRWGNADRATHGHKDYIDPEDEPLIGDEMSAMWLRAQAMQSPMRVTLHEQIADQWSGW